MQKLKTWCGVAVQCGEEILNLYVDDTSLRIRFSWARAQSFNRKCSCLRFLSFPTLTPLSPAHYSTAPNFTESRAQSECCCRGSALLAEFTTNWRLIESNHRHLLSLQITTITDYTIMLRNLCVCVCVPEVVIREILQCIRLHPGTALLLNKLCNRNRLLLLLRWRGHQRLIGRITSHQFAATF